VLRIKITPLATALGSNGVPGFKPLTTKSSEKESNHAEERLLLEKKLSLQQTLCSRNQNLNRSSA
jgi:hypothetical protein